MTYLLKTARKSQKIGLNIYNLATVSSLADDQPISWSTTLFTHATSYNFPLTFDGTTFTTPTNSSVYMFHATPCWYGTFTDLGQYKFGWYDTSSSAWVGTYGVLTSGANHAEGTVGGVVADETAIYVTDQAMTLQLRLESSANSYGLMTAVDTNTAPYTYFSEARLLVYKFD